ncbi:Wadjet anti-phage system protein JetA family protein [Rhizobium panacihumi]|uniref:Wadjet anti-phage system protein JetA family protein n=1 Tax=Rhizobium panacihumi TaxID=2008450 RepID=UPI003D7A7B35
MLFGKLHTDIFLVFAGPNRHFYELTIEKIYGRFYQAEIYFPSQNDILKLIYEQLGDHPHLWRDEDVPVVLDQLATGKGRRIRRRGNEMADAAATGDAMARARHVYYRLIGTGWLEPIHYGLKITVDMPPGAMRLAEFLCDLKTGVSELLGGLIVQVKTNLDHLQLNARENALGLHKAARDAASFGRYMRSVLSSLREIDKQVVASENISDRLRHYFEDFVERVLLQDYAAITTTSHPYRYRFRIIEALNRLEDSITDISAIAETYLEARLATNNTSAHELVHEDLQRIRNVFEQIEDAFEAIQQHRSRLETRLRNTVRYAGRRSGGFILRSSLVLLRLDRLVAAGKANTMLQGVIEPRLFPLSPFLLARPRNARQPIVGDALSLPPVDPVWERRKQLERIYIQRLTIRPEQVVHFLESRVPLFGEIEASHFRIDTVDDFLAFEALRLIAHTSVQETPDGGKSVESPLASILARHFILKPITDTVVDNEWLQCANFSVARRQDLSNRGN